MNGMSRPYHHGQLRTSLLEAGLELARSGGPEAVQLRAVTRAAGVSHNAAYRHFADQEELLREVSAACMSRLAVLMHQRTVQVRTHRRIERAWDRLEAIGRAYVEFARTEPGWFRTAFTAAAHSGDALAGVSTAPKTGAAALPEAASEAHEPFQLLVARLDELVEVGALPAERRPGAEFAAWSAVHGFASLVVDGPLHSLPEPELASALGVVVSVVQRGL